MNEFIEKLIGRLEEEKRAQRIIYSSIKNRLHREMCNGKIIAFGKTIEIVNQLAEEYNNEFCEWQYDEFETKWQTDCGVLFALHDSDREITHFCPCCGKKIKVVE